MKAFFTTTVALACLSLAVVVSLSPDAADAQRGRRGVANAGLSLGDRAPSRGVQMRNVDGEMTTIAAAAGERGTLVVFTCNHCPWAKAWEGRITALGNRFRGRGVGVIAINSNDPAEYPEDSFEGMQQHARDAGMRFPYVVDDTSNVARAFGATKTPEVFLFDAQGRLVYHGAVDDNPFEEGEVESHFLRDALAALVAGRDIARAETRAIGCGVKFRD